MGSESSRIRGEVTLITGISVSKKIELAAIDKLKKYNISHTQCKFSQGLRNPIYEIYGLFQVIHALRRIKPDVLHSATTKGNLIAVIAINFCRPSKLILSITGLGTCLRESYFKKQVYQWIFKVLMNLSLSRVRFSLIFENNSDRFIFRKFVNFKYSNSHIIGGSGVDTSKLKPVKGNLEKEK